MIMSLTLGFSSTTRGFHKMIFTSTILYTHLSPVIILAFTRIRLFTVSPFLLLALTRKELKQKQGGVLNSKSSHSTISSLAASRKRTGKLFHSPFARP
jgi:hypothetical protein